MKRSFDIVPLITVKATVATTHKVPKYPGWRLSREALESFATALRTGEIPMLFDHDARTRIPATVLDAAVVPVAEAEWALEAEFEVDAAAWRLIENRFAEAGVPGGFSFTASVPQASPRSGRTPVLILAADAAAWTDSDRVEAGAYLDEIVPTQIDRLFQYSGVELATIFLILRDVGLGVLGSAAYDALKHLLGRRQGPSRIEVHRRNSNGTTLKAIVTTHDPEVAREALELLEDEQAADAVHYDPAKRLWLDH